jgi:hypothetical protein
MSVTITSDRCQAIDLLAPHMDHLQKEYLDNRDEMSCKLAETLIFLEGLSTNGVQPTRRSSKLIERNMADPANFTLAFTNTLFLENCIRHQVFTGPTTSSLYSHHVAQTSQPSLNIILERTLHCPSNLLQRKPRHHTSVFDHL